MSRDDKIPTEWADAICDRINCYGLSGWLADLQTWMQAPDERWLPSNANDPLDIASPVRGVTLRMRPLSTLNTTPPPFRLQHWVLEHAIFNGAAARQRAEFCGLPFSLDSVREKPRDAGDKLKTKDVVVGTGTESETRRISYFLDDGRIVEITFGLDGEGIERVWVVRLGPELQYPGSTVGMKGHVT